MIKFNSFPARFTRFAGFTLVETLTTVTIFSLVVVIFGAVFAQAINIQRRAFNMQQVSENAQFVLESMAKEIRYSQIAGASNNCPSGSTTSLSIIHPVNGAVTYALSGTAIQRTVGGNQTLVSSNTVEFVSLRFCLQGIEGGDQRQPRVTILAKARSRNALQQETIDLQTTVSQRLLND